MSSRRRSVQFPHRGGTDKNGRRLSITSEMSEGGSRPTSPVSRGMNGITENEQVDVGFLSPYPFTAFNASYILSLMLFSQALVHDY